MRLKPDQLAKHLTQTLAPVYLISSDEPLQQGEALDAIRARARVLGYTEREVLSVEAGFNWVSLAAATANLSLFGDRRILELRLPTGKPGDAGSRALLDYCARPPEDTVLIITTGKLDKSAQASKWFSALDQAGAIVQIWAVDAAQLPRWITQRMQARGLHTTPEAAALIAERVEGNLLAAHQEIEKLLLLHGPGTLDLAAVTEAVANSARYDVFALAEAALAGDASRAARILHGLRAEDNALTLILWSVVREIRLCATLAQAQRGGAPLERAFAAHKVWDTRKPLYTRALPRHNLGGWLGLLRQAARADRVIKGQAPGDAWDEVLALTLKLSGKVTGAARAARL